MNGNSIADRTRRAVRERPFLHAALRAGVLNYQAAARSLDVDGAGDAIATALRRYAADLPPAPSATPTVRMRRNVSLVEDTTEPGLLTVGSTSVRTDGDGDATALLLEGTDIRGFARVTLALDLAESTPLAAAIADGTAVLVVSGDVGTRALRTVESVV